VETQMIADGHSEAGQKDSTFPKYRQRFMRL